MPRIRHVFSGREEPQIAHLFMNKMQDSARNGHGNFYFEGDTIYSYGRHFPIARHVTNEKGKSAVLFTTDTYSSTTRGHISTVRGALHGLVLHVPLYSNVNAFAYYASQIRYNFEKSVRARLVYRSEGYRRNALKWIEHARDYAKFYGEKLPKTLAQLIREVESPDAEKLFKERLKEQARREKENAKAKSQRDFAARLKFMQQVHELVLARLPSILENYRKCGKVLIYNPEKDKIIDLGFPPAEVTNHKYYQQVWPKGDLLFLRKDYNGKVRVTTSRGSMVGVRCSKEAYKQLTAIWKGGNNFPAEICGYRTGEVTMKYVRVGCHQIYREEIERFAKEQGW